MDLLRTHIRDPINQDSYSSTINQPERYYRIFSPKNEDQDQDQSVSESISINKHQSASININKHQSASSNDNVIVNQEKIYVYRHKGSKSEKVAADLWLQELLSELINEALLPKNICHALMYERDLGIIYGKIVDKYWTRQDHPIRI